MTQTNHSETAQQPLMLGLINAIWRWQLRLVALASVITWASLSADAGAALALGGLAGLVGTLALGYGALRGQLQPQAFLLWMCLGEVAKIILAALIFTIAIRIWQLPLLGLLIGYLLTSVAYVPAVLFNANQIGQTTHHGS